MAGPPGITSDGAPGIGGPDAAPWFASFRARGSAGATFGFLSSEIFTEKCFWTVFSCSSARLTKRTSGFSLQALGKKLKLRRTIVEEVVRTYSRRSSANRSLQRPLNGMKGSFRTARVTGFRINPISWSCRCAVLGRRRNGR
jgi:hypothetical protein